MIQIDIPMPEYCYDCPCHNGENGSCQITGNYYYDEIPRSCPLVEVPLTSDSAEQAREVIRMRIGDRCFVHGYVDEIRKDTIIIRNKGGYFGTNPGEVIVVNDTAHPNWIPCSEHLPEEEGSYLVTDDAGGMKTVQNDEFLHYEDGTPLWLYSQNVTAWRPLPEPYGGEQNDTD